jgi:protein gp37
MGDETKIQWTDHTFNPWIGCQRVSPGCEHCYAEARDNRFDGGMHWGPKGTRRVTSPGNWAKPRAWNREALAEGRRARVFCASLADVFEDRPELVEPRARLFALIEETPALDWQLLTKRPENMVRLAPAAWAGGWPATVWAGTTCEDQRRADERIPHLLRVPAAVRFLSCEPLVGAVDLGAWIGDYDCHACGARFWHDGGPGRQVEFDQHEGEDAETRARIKEGEIKSAYICPSCGVSNGFANEGGTVGRRDQDDLDSPDLHWVIVGGESGPGARPFDLAWARSLVSQSAAAGVACFVKQLGAVPVAPAPDELGNTTRPSLLPLLSSKGGDPAEWPADLRVRQFPEVTRGDLRASSRTAVP